MGLLKSEWIKATSVKSGYWLYGLGILLAVGLGAVMGQFVKASAGSPEMANAPGGGAAPLVALAGIQPITLNLVWIAAIIAVTGEYRYNTMKTTFLATPSRWPAVLVKTALYAVLGMVATALAVGGSLLVGGAISGFDGWTPFSGDGLRYLWRFPVYVGIGVFAVSGLANLMRNAAGAISLLLVWVLGVENMIMLIPKIGRDIQGWMPFLNGTYWVQGDISKGNITWGEPTALLWFAAVSAMLFVVGLVLTLRRDA